jgi:DNA repair protein RadD
VVIELRDYQHDSINLLREKVAEGYKSIVLVLITAAGKTVIASSIIMGAIEQGSRFLFVSHRREIIAQSYEKLVSIGVPEEKIGIIMGNGKITLRSGKVINAARKDAPIQIASIDTLRHRYRPKADIVFVDECHRALAASFVKLKSDYPDAYHIGLTATPFRYGGKGLGSYYACMVQPETAMPSKLIEKGWIYKARIWTVPIKDLPDLSGIKTRNGDYAEEELAEACNKRQLVGSIVDHWKERAQGRRTICFPVNIEHSKRIVQDFCDAGIAAEHLDGATPVKLRDEIISRLASGETKVVCSVGCLQEGFDLPGAKCAILARPTKSLVLAIQMSGRILRPYEENGRPVEPIILDHAGVILDHGMPTEDREYTLEDTKPKRKGMSTKTCLQCFAVVESIHKECPACGAPFPVQVRDVDRSIQHVEGQLVEYQYDQEAKAKKDYWIQLCADASKNGYQPGWAKRTFKEKYGHYPPKSWPGAYSRPMTAGEAEVMRARLQRVADTKGIPQGWVESKMAEVVVQQPAQPDPEIEAALAKPLKQVDLFSKPEAVKTVSKSEPTQASIEVNSEAIVRWEI